MDFLSFGSGWSWTGLARFSPGCPVSISFISTFSLVFGGVISTTLACHIFRRCILTTLSCYVNGCIYYALGRSATRVRSVPTGTLAPQARGE